VKLPPLKVYSMAETEALYGRVLRYLSDIWVSDANNDSLQGPGDFGRVVPGWTIEEEAPPDTDWAGSLYVIWQCRKYSFGHRPVVCLMQHFMDELGETFELLPLDSRGGS